MKFILTRHLETDWDYPDKNILTGQKNPELNEFGRERAEKLAASLANLGITRIISSDLKRSAQTASIIGDKLQIPVMLDKCLRECSFGSLEGMEISEVDKHYTPVKREIPEWHGSYNEYDFRPFGGESREEVLARHKDLLKELKRLYPKDILLLVGHGLGLNTFLASIGIEPKFKIGEWKLIDAEECFTN